MTIQLVRCFSQNDSYLYLLWLEHELVIPLVKVLWLVEVMVEMMMFAAEMVKKGMWRLQSWKQELRMGQHPDLYCEFVVLQKDNNNISIITSSRHTRKTQALIECRGRTFPC